MVTAVATTRTTTDPRAVAETVTDPELPTVTLADLGVLRDVRTERDGTVVVERAPAASAGERVRRHALASGESLWSVAQRYKVSVEDLKRWNKITNTRTVRAGQQLLVSAP